MIGSLIAVITSTVEVTKKFFLLVVFFVLFKVAYTLTENISPGDDGTSHDDTHQLPNLPDEKVVEKLCTSEDEDDDGTYCEGSHLLYNLPAENTVTKKRTSKRKRKRNHRKKASSNETQSLYKDSKFLFNPPNEVENVFTFKDIKCFDFEKTSKSVFDNSSKFASKQQNANKDRKLISLRNAFRYSCCEGLNSQTICKQQDPGIDEVQSFKSFPKEYLCDNSSLSQLLSKQQDDRTLNKAQPSKDFRNTNLSGNCSNSRLQSDEHEDENLDSALLSNNSLDKKLNENSESLIKQHNESVSDKALPSEGFLDTDFIGSSSNSQLSMQKDEENVENALQQSEDIENKPQKYSFNFHIVFKQQNKRMKGRRDISKIKENPEEVMSSIFDQSGETFYTADVAFFFKEKSSCLLAHSSVLASKSKYFRDLLFGGLPKESTGLEMDLEIKNVPLCIFCDIIKWFYSEKIEFPEDCTVLDIYQAAKHFKIQQLIDECRNYIESIIITEHNVLSNLQLSTTMKTDELNRRCIKYIEQNTLPVLNSVEFLKSPFSVVKKICELQRLNLTSEVDMLEALIRWLGAQQKLKKSATKSLGMALLRCVRFLNFTAEEFADVIAKHGALFHPDESLSIFLYLVDPNTRDLKELPEWCKKSYRTLPSNPKSIRKHALPIYSGTEKIEILLKDPDVEQDISELTSVLEMRCMNGIHDLKSIKFFFQAVKSKECVLVHLEIKVKVSPKDKIVYSHKVKNLRLKDSGFTLDFPKGVTVYEGQVLQMQVTANMRQCNFLKFDKWFPKSDFDCFFLSKPITGRLYFISEVEYGPLSP